ncbi:ABC transporter permease [Paractinoplanes deccanensis]|uniref:ABC transporter permease n=1 Tax=Paractinoplanes deccanensis TaxID=113561 RepID=A0ABQ3YKC9_9ACTN|nr:ABC transporter ATP-binding protein [Actinoplanes deccanensis]GID80380.1 ABC transporter permease [Actinoplanes deccanensis]
MGTVAAHGLRKSFGKVQALDGVTLDVPDGSFFVVLGPSGAGKTTTLRAIAGLEQLDAGSVHLDGRDATGDTPAERDLAMVFQSYALYPRRTAYENIASPLRARRRSPGEIAAAVDRVASLLHIERLLQRRPAQLSGGEMQRVALARALVRSPRAFLMDEPLTNLDLKLRVEMRTELTRIHRSLGATFVYVTNDQVEALSMADRVAVLKEGKVQQIGTPAEVYERPANQWVAGFVGSPPISLLPCQAQGDHLVGAEGWTLPRPRWATAEDGRALVLGLRAEDLSVERRGDASLPGELYGLEPLGDRTVVDVRVGTEILKVKARPTVTGSPGERLRVTVDLDRAHLFDAGTGLSLAKAGTR